MKTHISRTAHYDTDAPLPQISPGREGQRIKPPNYGINFADQNLQHEYWQAAFTFPPVIQRIQDLTDDEWTDQTTVLSAELQGEGGTLDLGKFKSGGGRHAEDKLIEVLPGLVKKSALPAGHYQLFFIINRSSCSDIGTSNKAPGTPGCTERLVDLQNKGLPELPGYRFQVTMHAKNLYGRDSQQRMLSGLAVEMGTNQGLEISVGTGAFDVGAAKAMSIL